LPNVVVHQLKDGINLKLVVSGGDVEGNTAIQWGGGMFLEDVHAEVSGAVQVAHSQLCLRNTGCIWSAKVHFKRVTKMQEWQWRSKIYSGRASALCTLNSPPHPPIESIGV